MTGATGEVPAVEGVAVFVGSAALVAVARVMTAELLGAGFDGSAPFREHAAKNTPNAAAPALSSALRVMELAFGLSICDARWLLGPGSFNYVLSRLAPRVLVSY